MDSVLSAGMSGEKYFEFMACARHLQSVSKGSKVEGSFILVVVLLFLLPPVFVELMDFNGHIS